MPIIGLTDQIQPKYPRLGKLRKGGERPANGNAPGPDLDHFRFVSENEEIVAAFVEAYGETPRLINVYLPHATPAEAFPTWAEVWGATGLVHRCDGKNMTIWLEEGKYIRGSKPCMGGHKDNDYLKDAVGRLDVVIPELVMAGYVGYVTLETHGKHDMLGILSTLQAVSDEGRRDLRGIPFVLRRVQESVSTPGFGKQAGKRSRVNKWLVKLEPASTWVQIQMGLRAAPVELEGVETEQLESGLVVDATTGELLPNAPAPVNAPTAPAPKPANNNGAKPPEEKPAPVKEPIAEQISAIGNRLWPGIWAEKKKALADAYSQDGKINLPGVLNFVQKREQNIRDLKQYIEHVEKSWPGFGNMVEPAIAEAEKGGISPVDLYELLQGIQQASVSGKDNPADRVAIMLSALTEMQIPMEFR